MGERVDLQSAVTRARDQNITTTCVMSRFAAKVGLLEPVEPLLSLLRYSSSAFKRKYTVNQLVNHLFKLCVPLVS
jgi:hypothetical protein